MSRCQADHGGYREERATLKGIRGVEQRDTAGQRREDDLEWTVECAGAVVLNGDRAAVGLSYPAVDKTGCRCRKRGDDRRGRRDVYRKDLPQLSFVDGH